MCARDTRLAGSVRDRERAVNLSTSSSVIANSTTRRHPAMMPLLVSPTAKQGIHHQPISSMMQVSWNRSSSQLAVQPVVGSIITFAIAKPIRKHLEHEPLLT